MANSRLFGLGAVAIIAALTWPVWKNVSPSLTSTVIALSTNPTSWFLLLLFTFSAYLFNWRTKAALESYISRLSGEKKASLAVRPAWKEALVAAGSIHAPAHIRFVFAENGRNARLYLDFSFFHPAVYKTNWTSPVRLEVKRFDHFARDQSFRVDLFEKVSVQGNLFWRFSFLAEPSDADNPKYILCPESNCRGRYTLLTEDHREYHCYFVAEPPNEIGGPPRIIGQHMFSHAWDWESDK